MEVEFIVRCETGIGHLWRTSTEASQFWTLICQHYKIISQAAVFIWADQLLAFRPGDNKILHLSVPFIIENLRKLLYL
jgi:hypothetical protein